jgi:hypothetical protein
MLEFPLQGTVLVGQLEEFYGIRMNAPADKTLDEVVRQRLGTPTTNLGDVAKFDKIALHVRELTDGGSIERIGMTILPQDDATA